MYVLIILMGVSLAVATGFVLAYRWAVRSGQYDDLYTPSVRLLFDDEPPAPDQSPDNSSSTET